MIIRTVVLFNVQVALNTAFMECSFLISERLSRDRRVVCLRRTGVNQLCHCATHCIRSLVLVQPRKTDKSSQHD